MAESGSVQDLGESRAQGKLRILLLANTIATDNGSALQALLNSLAANDTSRHGAQSNITQDQVRMLSDRLGEIMGDVELASNDPTERRNEKGEVCLASYNYMPPLRANVLLSS